MTLFFGNEVKPAKSSEEESSRKNRKAKMWMGRSRTMPSQTANLDERNDNEPNNDSRDPQDTTVGGVTNVLHGLIKREDVDKKNQTTNAAAAGPLLGLGDKRQKKIVYMQFSEKPTEAIQTVVEGIPEPAKENHVIIKVAASTVSLFDCMVRNGVSFESVEFPATPGVDVVGNIIKCGQKVTSFKVGDRVAALVKFGGNARYISVPESYLVEVPRSCEASEAVCMISTYMTAYQSLRMVTNDTFRLDGKCILITGGMDPVGQALVQLCLRAGAKDIYTTAPMKRHRYVKWVLGVNALSPEPEDWLQVMTERVDIVFDGTCQSPYGALKSDGILVCFDTTALLKGESPGILGAPLNAYWERLKRNVLSNTKIYDLWDSFAQDKNAFKVCLTLVLRVQD